jgi:hypothetical protein
MDLPGGQLIFKYLQVQLANSDSELRNRIYEMAAEYSMRCFPHTWPKNRKTRHSARRSSADEDNDEIIWPPPKPLPYLGLTQACTIIRTEFRPLWLSTHRFPLSVLDGYFRAFFPAPLRSSKNEELRKRIEKYHDPAGTLRLWISKDTVKAADILKLLKFKLRFPAYTFTPISSHPQVDEDTASLSKLLNNKTPKWNQWIKSNAIKQVRIGVHKGYFLRVSCYIVVKEPWAAPWMKSPYYGSVQARDDFVGSLGLGSEYLGGEVRFGVDYS